MLRANPSNDDEDRAKRPISVALGIIAVLTFTAALVGGVVVVIRYGIGSPMLSASRGLTVSPEVIDNESDQEPASELAMTILPFEPPDAAATSTFPLPEEFAALLDPVDAASQVVRTELPHEPPGQEKPHGDPEKDRAQIDALPKEDPQPSTVASETLTPTPTPVDDEPLSEPETQVPTPAAPDYWVISANSSRAPVSFVEGNPSDQPPLGFASFAQLGLGAPPAPGFTTPPAPMFTAPPAPGFTTPPAPMFTTPPGPGFTTPPAPMFTAPPAPGFTTPPAPGLLRRRR